jgi:hypothetical protein
LIYGAHAVCFCTSVAILDLPQSITFKFSFLLQ